MNVFFCLFVCFFVHIIFIEIPHEYKVTKLTQPPVILSSFQVLFRFLSHDKVTRKLFIYLFISNFFKRTFYLSTVVRDRSQQLLSHPVRSKYRPSFRTRGPSFLNCICKFNITLSSVTTTQTLPGTENLVTKLSS